MNALRLVALLTYTFGTFAYGAMLVLWVTSLGRIGWAGRDKVCTVSTRELDALNGALFFVSFVWFLLNAAQLLVGLAAAGHAWPLDAATIVTAFVFPPLIMHVTWAEVAAGCATPLARGWRLALWPSYVISLAIPAVSLAMVAGQIDAGVERFANAFVGSALSAAFIATAVYCIALVNRHGTRRASGDGTFRRPVMVRLFGLMIVIFLLVFAVSFFSTDPHPIAAAASLIEVAAKSLPLVFMFVSTYYENRFQFFDLFVKRGLALLMAIAALTIWFALTLPFLTPLAGTWAGPWLFAIALVPVVGAIPWMYGRVSAVLDRRWLGRRFSTVDAVTRFLSGLRSATTESDLTRQAEDGLAEIFGAPAAVRSAKSSGTVAFDIRLEVAVPGDAEAGGRFFMGARASDAPYFSQDVALLGSLAQVFASVLDNLRLQERKLEQDRRTQELSLHASRSELKALRAQINPHFLFNALNSIAGLIHREPAVADRTIEQLADVFRYALRGAESEWAVLDDELDFVRAYLEVERARFGDRLASEVHLDASARGARVPTMIVQTLVENAVKHGAASVRGRASVRVCARQAGGRLVVSVADNGPGFPRESEPAAPSRTRGGYGLVNIRQRLDGYFGSAAALAVERDAALGLTTVSVSLPFLRQDPRPQPVAEPAR